MKPYIQCKGPDLAYLSSGKSSGSIGYHAFFVTYIPFIPSFLSDDFTRMVTGGTTRIKLIVSRQIRFLNDLCSFRSNSFETFDLRFISIPQEGQPYSNLHIFFIGKVFSPTKLEAETLAFQLWEKFQSNFPFEDPFNYPLRTITMQNNSSDKEFPSEPDLFNIAINPLSLKKENKWKIVEIRKYEDRDPMLVGGDENPDDHFVGYFPHPFMPTLDHSAMSRFLETFTKQDQICVASICLRPTTLALSEQQQIHRMIKHYEALAKSADEENNWISLYRIERIKDIAATFDPVINQRNHLFIFKIQILGSDRIPQDVVSALGSEIMNNTTPEPRMWRGVVPDTPEEETIAMKNFSSMEFRPWKRSNLDHPLWRLSSLVTSYEAVGAFRLPIPPESGHLPGIKVKDEPFVTPAELISEQNKIIKNDVIIPIGKIIHRGLITETDYTISLSQLKRHGLIAGSTGSGKSNTCLHILTELWKVAQIPFLVIYPIDKPDYRLLAADKKVKDDLLIFTLGDDTTSPFRFNPMQVPDGILVRTYISHLMRTFSAAFSMWDPLPAVYRAALRNLYQEAGYKDLRIAKGGDPDTKAPLLSRFYEILVETADEMTKDYGREAKGNIKQGSEIRIRDLLQNAGSVINVDDGVPWNIILSHPTVMEIGRVGSPDDSALIMGFLLMSLTSYLSSRRMFCETQHHHITLIEEAHRLMSSKSGGGNSFSADPRAKASEDFANILAEVRGFNESILIAEQIPTELVSGAIGNTFFKVMHWLEEQSSFDLFTEVMNLNKQQREYARTLPTGQAIVRGLNARPILVQITNYMDQFQNPDDTLIIDDSDTSINKFMKGQLEKLKITLPEPRNFLQSQANSNEEEKTALTNKDQRESHSKLTSWPFFLPMQTCVFCEMVNQTNKCRYKKNVRSNLIMNNSELRSFCDPIVQTMLKQKDLGKLDLLYPKLIETFQQHFHKFVRNIEQRESLGHFYCYLAHYFSENFTKIDQDVDDNKPNIKPIVRDILVIAQNDIKQHWNSEV